MRSRRQPRAKLHSVLATVLSTALITLSIQAAGSSEKEVAFMAAETIGPLPEPWTSQDIGIPSLAGNAGATSTGIVIDAAGSDIAGSSDEFHFAYQMLTGDGEVLARVDNLKPTHVWAKAGVMIRESLAADSRHGLALLSAGQGVAFLRRTTTGGSSAAIRGSRVRAPYWVRLVRRGTTLEAYEAQDGSNWTLIGRETLALPETVYAGLAVTSHDAGTRTTANFSVVAVRAAGNRPPATWITSPVNGATFAAPATIAVTADGTDPDGSIASVDFYAGPALLGTATSRPFSVTWSNVPAGTYSLTAVAIDDAGATAVSESVSVAVVPTNQPPSVALTSPAQSSSVAAPATVNLAATAADVDGTISHVEFYAASTLLGTDATSPYALALDLLSPGAYTITAVAVDNLGARTASPAVTLTATPSFAVFTASADHDTLVTSYRLEIFVAGADPDIAAPVVVQDLGKPVPVSGEITVDITTTLQPLANGNYVATVSALGMEGTARSAPTTFVR